MEIIAKPREILGKKVKKLRREGVVPAVVFGQGKESVSLSIDEKELLQAYAEAGESTLVDLAIEGQAPRKVLISEIQYHPLSDRPLHVNFHEVNLKEKITTTIPIKVIGESALVKSGEGIILTLLDEVEVECLPTDLPSEFTIDISHLNEVGQSIAIKDLTVDASKVEISADPEDLILKIDYAQMAEEEEEVDEAEAVGQVEATEEKGEGEEESDTEEEEKGSAEESEDKKKD